MTPPREWSEDEDRILLASGSYDEYAAKTAGAGVRTRNREAVRSRRYELKQKGVAIPEWARGAQARRYTPTGERLESNPESGPESEPESIGFRDRLEDEDTRDYWEAQKRAIAAHQRRIDRHSNRVISHTTSEPEQPFGLFFFGDTHIGSNGILAERMEREFEAMRQACETLGARLVFMGDAIENAKIIGKAAPAVYDQGIPPSPQRDVADLLFRPMAPYFVAFLEGNHDSRDAHSGGIGWLQTFAADIGVPYVSEAGCAIHLTHGFQRYTIYAKHDWRGKSQINKANSLRRFWQEYPEWDNADLGVLAHLHEPLYESVQQKGRRVHWIRTGSWKVYDHYAEKNGYSPEVGVAVVIFWPNERRITVSLDLEDGIAMLADARRRSTEAA